MENLLFNLKYVMRYSGVRLITPESDTDHTFDMIAIALHHIANWNESYKKLNLPEINKERLIYKIAIHDLGEAFSTDLPRPFKYKTKELKAEVDRAEHLLLVENLDEALVNEIENAKDETLEGRWVALLDLVQAGTKMVDETHLGNHYMRGQLSNVIESLTEWVDSGELDLVQLGFVNQVLDEFNKYKINE